MNRVQLSSESLEFVERCLDQSHQMLILMLTRSFVIEKHSTGSAHLLGLEQDLTGQPLQNFLLIESHHLLTDSILQHKMPFLLNFKSGDSGYLSLHCQIHQIEEGYLLFGDRPILADSDILRNMTTLNNEMARMTRELNRKNIALAEAQGQLLHQEKMASIGQLAAGMAHEINNPIGFVKSNLTSMEKYAAKLQEYNSAIDEQFQSAEVDGHTTDQLLILRKKLKIGQILEDIPELIEESLDGIERVSEIVKNLKNFSRIGETNQNLACINECLDTTLKMVLSELQYKANIVTEFGEIAQIKCSAAELNQVFMNLLANAGHAIEENGEISIKTWQENSDICIRIADNGKGIAAENLKHIFDPFFTTREPGKGTGLGLSISYDIIRKHNGSIAVESTPGKGTSFTITLLNSEDLAITEDKTEGGAGSIQINSSS